MDEPKETAAKSSGSVEIPAAVQRAGHYEDVLMREAHELTMKKQYAPAAAVLNDVVQRFGVTLEPQQKSLLHSELGTLFFWLGDYDSARRHCEDAAAFSDTNDQAFIILGKIAVAQFQFPKARGYFSKVSSKNSGRPLGMCLVSLKLRDIIGAEVFLRDAEGLVSQTDPELRVYKTYFQLLKGDPTLAIKEARTLIKKCERDPALMLLLAEIFMTAGNYGEASAVAKKVGHVCPENDGVFAILAHAAYAEEDLGAAENHARDALRFNPANAYAKTVLMKLATRDGRYETAEVLGMQILADCPEYSLGHANLGDVYFNQGRYELAETEYEQTLELMNSQTKGAHLRQARMKFIEEDYKAAAHILEKLIESEHTYYDDAMCDLFLCYERLGDEEKKDDIVDKMQVRRSFYRRTENLLKSFEENS